MISDVAESPRPQEALGNYLKRIGARLIPDLRTEVEVLSRIKHPHIVNLYGACLTPPHCCLIEELMEGSLADVVHRRPGRMAYRDILRVANQVSLALAYIH